MTPIILVKTQHMLRLSFDNNSGEGTGVGDITQADLVAACAPGPLRALFANPFAESDTGGVSAWTDLESDARLSVHVANAGEAPVGSGYEFISPGSVNTLRVSVAQSGIAIVELRFDHTIGR